MKTIVQDEYGPPEELLDLREIDGRAARDAELVRSLGADREIDHTREDITRRGSRRRSGEGGEGWK